MKKTIAEVFLAALLVLSISTTALAVNAQPLVIDTEENTVEKIFTDKLKYTANVDYSYAENVLTLHTDISLCGKDAEFTSSYLSIELGASGSLVIDLNGYSLSGALAADADISGLIMIKGGEVTITDSKAGDNNFVENKEATNPAGIFALETQSASLIIDGITVQNKGAIINCRGGKLAAKDSTFVADGPVTAIVLLSGSADIQGCTITNLSPDSLDTGIVVDDHASLVLEESSINNFFTGIGPGDSYLGGTVFLFNSHISDCDTGVYLPDSSKFSMYNGSILCGSRAIYANTTDLAFSGRFNIEAEGEALYIMQISQDNSSPSFSFATGTIKTSAANVPAISINSIVAEAKIEMTNTVADSEIFHLDATQDVGVYLTTFSTEDISAVTDFAEFGMRAAKEINFTPVTPQRPTNATIRISRVSPCQIVITPALVGGYSDGSFHPESPIRRGEAAKMLATIAGSTASELNSSFCDVKSSDWFAPFVAALYAKGYISGYPDGSFRAEENISVAEFIAIVCRIKGVAESTAPSGHAEAASDWAKGYVQAADEQGWLADFLVGSLNPSRAITRVEAVLILNQVTERYDKQFVTVGPAFSDVPATYPHYDAISRAASEMQ